MISIRRVLESLRNSSRNSCGWLCRGKRNSGGIYIYPHPRCCAVLAALGTPSREGEAQQLSTESPPPLSAPSQSQLARPAGPPAWALLGLLWATLAAVTAGSRVNSRPPASGRPGPSDGLTAPRPAPALLALDPGSAETGWALLESTGVVVGSGTDPNDRLLEDCRMGSLEVPRWGRLTIPDAVVVEWTAPRGMPASAQLFETMFWIGRFVEALEQAADVDVNRQAFRLERAHVKRALCGTSAAKDANVRAALIDRYGGAGGKEAAIGRKAAPGPLFGVSGDGWAALAVGVAWLDGVR